MKFWEAMKALEEGKKIRCKDWGKESFWMKNCQDRVAWEDCKYRIDLMMGNEWELYEEPEKTYSFMEIVPGLKIGKKYRRKHWDPKFYVVKHIHGIQICSSDGFVGIETEDLEAKDWLKI